MEWAGLDHWRGWGGVILVVGTEAAGPLSEVWPAAVILFE